MSREPLAHIALHDDPRDVIGDAVATARRITGRDSAFAAVATHGGPYLISARIGLRDPGWEDLEVLPGRGLGGVVIADRSVRIAADYLNDRGITSDYRPIVRAEGLRSVFAVPLIGPRGVVGALYVGDRAAGHPGDRAINEVEQIADMVRVALVVAARTPCTPPHGQCITLSPAPTARELDVLHLLDQGASNREISRRLMISESTAKGHVASLREKLGARSRLDAVARARAAGLLAGGYGQKGG